MHDTTRADAGILLPPQHEALARLEFTTTRQRGFALLTGPAGSGKTGLLRRLADGLRRDAVPAVFVDAQGCGETDLLRECCDELGLGCSRDAADDALCTTLLEAVRGRCAVGTSFVLLVDHAGDGAARLIERLLHATNEVVGPTLIAACRQPAPPRLAAIARDHSDVRIQLPPLTPDDTGRVIESLRRTDVRHVDVTPQAVNAIHSVADGELRQVHRLWRLLRTAAVVDETDAIDERMVDAIVCELSD